VLQVCPDPRQVEQVQHTMEKFLRQVAAADVLKRAG